MCLDHLRSFEMVRPKYGFSVTSDRNVLSSLYEKLERRFTERIGRLGVSISLMSLKWGKDLSFFN